jgi:hemerythrin superfamily protein
MNLVTRAIHQLIRIRHKELQMPKTFPFTRNSTGEQVLIVLDKITHVERDNFSECTNIVLEGGQKIDVSETVDEVHQIIEDD